jgi:hypothetical protein
MDTKYIKNRDKFLTESKNEMSDDYKKTSTTGKKVEKRQVNTDILLGTWETIAKTASSENMSAAKLSRMIKNKTVLNDYYFV